MIALSPQRLSALIGAIYDCTIDPDRWPNTMEEICRDLDCMGSVMLIHDLRGLPPTFLYTWNTDRTWIERYLEHVGEVAAIYNSIPDALNGPLDNPLVLSHFLDERTVGDHRVYREWAAPQGICDFIQTTALRALDRIGGFSAQRHNSVGRFTDREVEIMRLLAPHIRRAVTISDLMDLKKLETRAVAVALDNLSAGVVVVTNDSRILHANQAAQLMFNADEPVRSLNGKLSATDPAATRELAKAVALAQRNEATIGATGIGVALKGSAGEAAIAHVLPLAHGELRTRLMPQATAAVFVTQAGRQLSADMSAIAKIFGFTPAEARMLEHMTPSVTLVEIARALCISEATARTHLSRIFAKTGVSRQADLFALLASLAPPVQRPARD